MIGIYERHINVSCMDFLEDIERCTFWDEIKVTGRWKIERANEKSELYLEKQYQSGFIFTKTKTEWIHESRLKIIDKAEYINECN